MNKMIKGTSIGVAATVAMLTGCSSPTTPTASQSPALPSPPSAVTPEPAAPSSVTPVAPGSTAFQRAMVKYGGAWMASEPQAASDYCDAWRNPKLAKRLFGDFTYAGIPSSTPEQGTWRQLIMAAGIDAFSENPSASELFTKAQMNPSQFEAQAGEVMDYLCAAS